MCNYCMAHDPDNYAVASSFDLDESGCVRVWFPPTGKPYWVTTRPNAGPDLTEMELRLVKEIARLRGKLRQVEFHVNDANNSPGVRLIHLREALKK